MFVSKKTINLESVWIGLFELIYWDKFCEVIWENLWRLYVHKQFSAYFH